MKRQLVVLLFLIVHTACLGDIIEPADPMVDSGKLYTYTNKNHFWGEFKNAKTTQRWVDIGAPNADCDLL